MLNVPAGFHIPPTPRAPLVAERGSSSFVAHTALLLATQQLFCPARSSLPPKHSQTQHQEKSQAGTCCLPRIFHWPHLENHNKNNNWILIRPHFADQWPHLFTIQASWGMSITVLVFIAVQRVQLLYRNRIPANFSGICPGYQRKSLYVTTFLSMCKNCSDFHSTAQVGFEATTVLCSRGTFDRSQTDRMVWLGNDF